MFAKKVTTPQTKSCAKPPGISPYASKAITLHRKGVSIDSAKLEEMNEDALGGSISDILVNSSGSLRNFNMTAVVMGAVIGNKENIPDIASKKGVMAVSTPKREAVLGSGSRNRSVITPSPQAAAGATTILDTPPHDAAAAAAIVATLGGARSTLAIAKTPFTGPPMRVLIKDQMTHKASSLTSPQAASHVNTSADVPHAHDRSSVASTPKRIHASTHSSHHPVSTAGGAVPCHSLASSPSRTSGANPHLATVTPKGGANSSLAVPTATMTTPQRPATASKASGSSKMRSGLGEVTPTRPTTASASKAQARVNSIAAAEGTPKRAIPTPTSRPTPAPRSNLNMSPTKSTVALAAVATGSKLIVKPVAKRPSMPARPTASLTPSKLATANIRTATKTLSSEIVRSRSFCSNLSPVNDISGLTCDYEYATDADLSINTFVTEGSYGQGTARGAPTQRSNNLLTKSGASSRTAARALSTHAPARRGSSSRVNNNLTIKTTDLRIARTVRVAAEGRQLLFPTSKESALSSINNYSNSTHGYDSSVMNDMNVLNNHPVLGLGGSTIDSGIFSFSAVAASSTPRHLQLHLQPKMRRSTSNPNLNSMDRSSNNIIMNSNTFDYSESGTISSYGALNRGMIVFDSIDTSNLGASGSLAIKDDTVSGILASSSSHNILLASSLDFQRDGSGSDTNTAAERSNVNNVAFYREGPVGRARGNRYSSDDDFDDDSSVLPMHRSDDNNVLPSDDIGSIQYVNYDEDSSYQNSSMSLTAIKICNSNYETDNSFETDYINEFIANSSSCIRSSSAVASYSLGLATDVSGSTLASSLTNINNNTIATESVDFTVHSRNATNSNIINTISIASSTASYDFSSIVGAFHNTTGDTTGPDIDDSSSFSFCAEVNTDSIRADMGNSREHSSNPDPLARQLEVGVGLPAPFYSAAFVPLNPVVVVVEEEVEATD